jgi:uncharacterized protein YxeA
MSRKVLIIITELVAFTASVALGIIWTANPSGSYEPFIVVTGLAFVATELYRRYEGRLFKTEGRFRTPSERVHHHETLRKQFEEEIYRCRGKELRKDVIIRHVNRIDDYPNINEKKKGISPWFRVGLLGAYHKGIKVGLRWGTLTEGECGLRFTNYRAGEAGSVKVILMGEIPYDFIETMNVDGDEYYYFPHIYCHFARNGEPYERLFFCEEIDRSDGHPYYKEIVTYEEVKRNSKNSGAEYFA